MTDTFEVPEHDHRPDYGEAFFLEGAFVIPCAVEGCTFEAHVEVPSLTWIEPIL